MKKTLCIEEYDEIENCISNEEELMEISKKFKVSYDTIFCISSQMEQNRTKMILNHHRKSEKMFKYYQLYSGGKTILQIARKFDLSPTLMARIILEYHLELANISSLKENEIELLPSFIFKENKLTKQKVSEYIKDICLIEEQILREQVKEAIMNDRDYSPFLERIRSNLGIEYEYILKQNLINNNIKYLEESQLREKGFPKTPDTKLLVPITIEGGHVIYWIESKASFGDYSNHKGNMNQLLGYLERYGPGIVIYWFGFVEELNKQENSEQKILIFDHFPKSIKTYF